MDDDERTKDREQMSGDIPEERASPVAVPRKKRSKTPLVIAGTIIGAPLVAFAMWTAIALNWNYSTGTRTGYIQKFSEKGWICKTWEGEIAMVNSPGAVQEKFLFTVRDDSVAAEINKVMGTRVALMYTEHRGVPTSCFGETGHYVNGVKALP